jgi:SAM-dependent methyltransferase
MTAPETVRSAYDGSTALFRLLATNGWGELLNLGYYRVVRLPLVVFGLARFQRELADRSIALLDPRPGQRVLDACCGRGYTTARIAESGAEVLGLDLLEEHVEQATDQFGGVPNVQFASADVTGLPASAAGSPLGDGALDGVHCLEAAFHFGPAGRRAFLAEAYRVLRPGGRLVLVDFTWRDEHPDDIAACDPDRLVRDTWRFEEFEPLSRYRRTASELGFRERAAYDWTTPVMARFSLVGHVTARIGLTRVGRAAMRARPFRDTLGRVPTADWREIIDWLRAGDAVRRASRYTAFVFEKPEAS